MKIALAQIQSTDDIEHNLAIISEYTRQAAQQHTDLIVFPEASLASFASPISQLAQPLDSPWVQEIQTLSNIHNIAIAVGIFTPSDAQRIYNTLIFSRPGQPLTHYHKIHLYDAFHHQESAQVCPGNFPVCVPYKDTYIGLTLCYDIRFPALYTHLAHAGARIIIISASWGDGEDKLRQWKLLAQARAIDTGSWILACDQATAPRSSHTRAPLGVGHSLLCSPWGNIVAELGNEPEILYAEIDTRVALHAQETTGVLSNHAFNIAFPTVPHITQ